VYAYQQKAASNSLSHTLACTHRDMHKHTRTYMHTHTHTHSYTYTHTHTECVYISSRQNPTHKHTRTHTHTIKHWVCVYQEEAASNSTNGTQPLPCPPDAPNCHKLENLGVPVSHWPWAEAKAKRQWETRLARQLTRYIHFCSRTHTYIHTCVYEDI